jgi:Tfp pilus assembly protein PilV
MPMTEHEMAGALARARDSGGFTIVEVAVAASVLLIGVLGALTLFDAASVRTLENKQRESGNSLARELAEQVRAVPYGQLNDNTIVSKMQALPGLENSNGGSGGWTVKRSGTSYSIDAYVCTVDDPKDGVGANVGSDFCAASTAPDCQSTISVAGGVRTPGAAVRLCVALGGELISTLCGVVGTGANQPIGGVPGGIGTGGSAGICTPSTQLDDNPNDYKLALFDVSWTGPEGRHYDRQATVIPNPGTGAGPSVTNLVPTALPGDTLSSPVVTNIDFTATTSTTANNVQWSVDAAVRGRATLSGTTASFTWDTTGLVDGSYLIGAQAFSASGESGIARTRTITINRRSPPAVTGFVAGRNGSIMDFEWNASPERDVVGYRVFQQVTGGPDVGLCALTANTYCRNETPPATDPMDVYVVAYDRDLSGNLRAGTASAIRTVRSTNRPPNAPTSLTASTSAGSAILNWLPPAVPDPDPGDKIEFYRIYRDGRTYNDRYDKSACSGVTCTYTDARTAGTTHTYWITAVDTQLAESTVVGPVTA